MAWDEKIAAYMKDGEIQFEPVYAEAMAQAELLKPMIADVSRELNERTRPVPTCCSKARRARCWTSTTAPTRS
jgi:hypothetical protein